MNVWLALFLTVLSWAVTFHLGHYAVGLMTPIAVVIWRFVLAAALLIPLVSLREQWSWAVLWKQRWVLLLLGGGCISGFQLGIFYGLQTSTASNAALLMGFTPALTVALSAVVDRRAVRPLQLAGLLLGLIGVVVVVCRGQWSALRALDFAHGDLLLIVGALAWAVYSVVLQRKVRGLSNLQITASTIFLCAAVMVIVTAVVAPQSLQWPPAAVWPAMLFMGLVGSGLAYLWWNEAVASVGASRAASFMNVVPVLTILIAIPLGEPLFPAQLLGAMLVIAGVLLATRS